MNNFYIMVGIPGSGKSTFTTNHECVVVSSDAIREELNGSAASQANGKLIFDEFYRRIREALVAGKDVIADATNTNKRARKALLKLAPEGTITTAVVMDVPFEVASVRNAGRTRVVPEFVLRNMQASLEKEPPALQEGFTKIVYCDENGEVHKKKNRP